MANGKNLFAGPRGKHVAPAGTVIGHEHAPSREIERAQSQERGLARAGGRPKASGHVPVHGGMHRTTGTSLGAPVTSMLSVPNASSANVLAPTHAGKRFPAPRPAFGTPPRSQRATYDPELGARILAEALADTADHAHEVGRARLPDAVSEK